MAIFDPRSRYVRHAEVYEVVDRRGRVVKAVTPARPPGEETLGEHARRQGERLDHLASYYLGDAAAYWRIAELEDAVLPEALSEIPSVKIPVR